VERSHTSSGDARESVGGLDLLGPASYPDTTGHQPLAFRKEDDDESND
jgi:hypothetical protein